jgi:acyl-CoA synthetase (AMP-forming)/AMP-acid ligase II
VLLVFPTSFEFVAAFIGVQLRGAIPVPAYPPAGLRLEAGLERLAHIARRAGNEVILTSALLRAVCGDVALRAPGVRAVEVVEVVDASVPRLPPRTARCRRPTACVRSGPTTPRSFSSRRGRPASRRAYS